ncbi:MAG: type II toxin-antitoxin system HicA family toxin [bacterium]|nr:type II toxin-antitoxin system HicA family toxin [bacterium]
MAIYTYDQMRKVLKKLGFEKVREKKHETWERVLKNKVILQIRLSHKGKRDIPNGIFYEMLRQAGIDEAIFKEILENDYSRG